MQSVLPREVNLTFPVGHFSDDLTVADSLTLASTFALLGLADTVVLVDALLVVVAADAMAGMARMVHAAAATAVSDTSRAGTGTVVAGSSLSRRLA